MHPRIAETVALLDEARRTLREAVNSVPESARGTRPGPERWSTAEVLDHLAKVEGSIAGLFEKRIAEAKANGLEAETETSPVVDRSMFLRLQDRTRTIEAAGNARPAPDADWRAAWTALEGTREKLLASLANGEGLALGKLTFPHRVFGPMNFYQWAVFAAGHESRHAAQIAAMA
jgi:uncharacterized damage-inducible protein DinB